MTLHFFSLLLHYEGMSGDIMLGKNLVTNILNVIMSSHYSFVEKGEITTLVDRI